MIGKAIRRLAVYVFHNRRDPNGVKAHALDIVQLVDYSLVGASTVLAVLRIARRRGVFDIIESIRYKLTKKYKRSLLRAKRLGQTW